MRTLGLSDTTLHARGAQYHTASGTRLHSPAPLCGNSMRRKDFVDSVFGREKPESSGGSGREPPALGALGARSLTMRRDTRSHSSQREDAGPDAPPSDGLEAADKSEGHACGKRAGGSRAPWGRLFLAGLEVCRRSSKLCAQHSCTPRFRRFGDDGMCDSVARSKRRYKIAPPG